MLETLGWSTGTKINATETEEPDIAGHGSLNDPRRHSVNERAIMYFRLGLLFSFGIAACDLSTKWLVANVVMNPPQVIEVLPFMNFVPSSNRGISFGLLSSESTAAPYLLSTLALVIVVFMMIWLRRSKNAVEAIGIGVVIGGASGNIVDRLADGAVSDFIGFSIGSYHWPAFNIADIAIVCGVVLIVALPWLHRDRRSRGPVAR